MKAFLTLTILTLATFGCANKRKDNNTLVSATQEKTDQVFEYVADFPTINDTTKFIADLRQIFEFHVDESPVQKKQEKITEFRRVKLYGSNNDYFFIEYDYATGSMASYPWKYQLLLKADGSLVQILAGQRFDFITIFPNQRAFLMMVTATAKGNGGHEIYKISDDTLQNIYEGSYLHSFSKAETYDYGVRTYDAHQDWAVFEPNELKMSIKDENMDGFNDLIFTGQKLMLGKYKDSLWRSVENGKPFTVENPADRILIKYIFFYDKQTGHFKAKEKYIQEN